MAALARIPSYTPVRCHVIVDANLHDGADNGVAFNGMAGVTAVHTSIHEVVLEVEE